jgi:hypothetical protein
MRARTKRRTLARDHWQEASRRGTGCDKAEGLVHAAASVSLKVDGNVREPNPLQARNDAIVESIREEARQVGRRNLDARNVSVMPNAYLTEPQLVQGDFGPVNLG